MLKELSIKNFAIIENLKIQLQGGLTILSGETGAGKSIIINALNLLSGHRATEKFIRTGTDTAVVEGFFDIDNHPHIIKMMEDNDLSPENGLLVRRIISKKDRHKIYINDRLSTIQLLSQLTANLVNISGQHAHQRLLNEDEHLLIVDQFGKLMPLRETVCHLYNQLLPLIDHLKQLRKQQANQADHIELIQFQLKEIKEASILDNEDKLLENEHMRLQHAETIFQKINQSVHQLYDSDGAIIEQLSKVQKDIEQASALDQSLSHTCGSVQELSALVDDITGELRQYLEGVHVDDERLHVVEDRIYLLNRLKRKYGGSLETIELHLQKIEEELNNIESIDTAIETAMKNVSNLHEQLKEASFQLSEKRKKCAKNLSISIEKELHQLKMVQTRFQVLIDQKKKNENSDEFLSDNTYLFTETGIDRAAFMIAPNVGEAMKPLAAIASGGELSRVVLALKAILAGTESVSTVVFDEVDAGIGGGVAEMVGQKMVALSDHHQIICITHLPQIAKYGQHHFRIAKQVEKGRTHTNISPINHNERIHEIARMLGGEIITEKTIAHAREMLTCRVQ